MEVNILTACLSHEKKVRTTYTVLFLILTFFTVPSFSNTIEVNTPKLHNTVKTENISANLQLADSIRNTTPHKFKELLDKLKQQQHLFNSEQNNYYNFIYGYYLTYRGEFIKAKLHFESTASDDTSYLLKSRINSILIIISITTQKWSEGLKLISTNLKYLPELKNTQHYQDSLLVIVQFYNQIKQFNLALSYIHQLSSLSLSGKNACLLEQLSLEAKFNLNKLQITDKSINEAISLCEKRSITIATNIIRIYKAKLNLKNNDPGKALEVLLPHENIVNSTHYPMLISEFSNTVAKSYWLLSDIQNTKIYTHKALTANNQLTNLLQGVDTYNLLFQVAKKERRFELALSYFEKYSEINEMNLEGEKAKHLAFQLAEHRAIAQESQIKLLNEQNNALAAEQALANTQANNRKLIILLLALIILVFAFFGARLWRTHKRVRQLAEYDPLTGIFNRGHFTQVTNSALKYCQNAEQDLSLIMFDLDHFKKVNDTFGHACGDWALKETIKVCKDIGRQNDIFARLGGEEFCLVLPSCNIDAAMLRAEACRAAIEAIITEESKHDFTITASFGVTDVKRSGFNLDKLLADADMAAYDSKNSGRNRVTIHQVPETKVEPLDNSWSL